jgi:hypothetical protein
MCRDQSGAISLARSARRGQHVPGLVWDRLLVGARMVPFAADSMGIDTRSGRVVKNDAHHVPLALAHLAHAMAQFDPVHTARSLHGPFVHREYHRVAFG